MSDFPLRLVDYAADKPWFDRHITRIGDTPPVIPTFAYDIEKACTEKQAFLFVDDDKNFVVLKPLSEAGEVGVQVLVAYSKSGDAIITHDLNVECLAKQINAAFIAFWTVRKGFNRVAPRHGWVNYNPLNDQGFTEWRKYL